MSAARIDHAAQARKIMLEVNTDERGIVPLELLDDVEKWVYDSTMREAQVHATLALVEQQRITNLLLLIKPENPREFDTWDEIADALRLRP